MSISPLPEPPRMPGKGMARQVRNPRKRGLTEAEIVDAAMAIVDAEGLDALTMRAVAGALGTGAASLYAYVGSKDDLIDLLIERVTGEMWVGGQEAPDPERWQDQLKQMATSMRDVWGRHGDLARASFARIPTGENSLKGIEWMLAVLRAGGLSDRVVGLAPDLIGLYIGGIAYEDSLENAQIADPADWETFGDELSRYFTELPADRFPNLVALAGALTLPADRFEFGMDVILAGLTVMAQADPQPQGQTAGADRPWSRTMRPSPPG